MLLRGGDSSGDATLLPSTVTISIHGDQTCGWMTLPQTLNLESGARSKAHVVFSLYQ